MAPRMPNYLPHPGPRVYFGAEAAAAQPPPQPNITVDTSGMKSPLMFLATLSAGIVVGYLIGRK